MATRLTVDDVYKLGIGMLPEKLSDNPELQDYAIGWTNIMLAECFPIENSLRAFRGEEELTEVPHVSALTDEIPYDYCMVMDAFPYGIAEHAFIDDDDNYRANVYRSLYQTRANESQRFIKESITDKY